jgi:hypothetical protein
MSSDSCGPPAADGGVCSIRVYPKAVISSVRKQMKAMTQMDNNTNINVSKRMELDAIMKAANLKDAAVSVKQDWILTLIIFFDA